MREQLRAETDAEHRLALLQHPFDRAQLGAQMRPRMLVLDVHRPAQHDQAAIAVHAGLRLGLALEVDEADAVAALADQRIERAERFGGDMLEDEKAGHAPDSRTRCAPWNSGYRPWRRVARGLPTCNHRSRARGHGKRGAAATSAWTPPRCRTVAPAQPSVPPVGLANRRVGRMLLGILQPESEMTAPTEARVTRTIRGMPASDGAGVKLTRVIGTPQLPDLDPFLMLDEFGTDRAEDYLAGFPDHPHRGFETVTYMLDGRMRHRDNHGNEGLLVPGSVQWMTAGRGLVHSEMPEQEAGRMRGFQLWVNLPARDKMGAPKYQEFAPEALPVVTPAAGVSVKLIAGHVDGVAGPIVQPRPSRCISTSRSMPTRSGRCPCPRVTTRSPTSTRGASRSAPAMPRGPWPRRNSRCSGAGSGCS